jgi:hypothetical protein
MHPRFLFKATFFLAGFASALTSDVALPFNNDALASLVDQNGLFPDPEIFPTDLFGVSELPWDPTMAFVPPDSRLDQIASPFNEWYTPEGPEPYLTDSFESENWVTNSIIPTWSENDVLSVSSSFEDDTFGKPFQLVDCSTSEYIGAIGKKSRVRRFDNPGLCKNPTSTPPTDVPDANNGEKNPRPSDLGLENIGGMLESFVEGITDVKPNEACRLYTQGLLPWGVCSSGRKEDETLQASQSIQSSIFSAYEIFELQNCKPGKFNSEIRSLAT